MEVAVRVLVCTVLFIADDHTVYQELMSEMNANKEDVNTYLASKNTLLHYTVLEALRLQPALCKWKSRGRHLEENRALRIPGLTRLGDQRSISLKHLQLTKLLADTLFRRG